MVTTAGTPRDAERARRAVRILDAAGELLLSLGYGKITMEDVARRAGVGKGTVYLHFPTKEVLFGLVVVRVQLEVGTRLIEAMRTDPAAIMPGATARWIYLTQHETPLVKAILARDPQTLGGIVETVGTTQSGLIGLRARVMQEYFTVLRGHGLLRTDRPVEEQNYLFVSSVLGGLVAPPLLSRQSYPVPEARVRADILGESVRRSLEEDADPDALLAARPEVLALFEGLMGWARKALEEYLPSTE
ncbi:TetR/AcrR family transcriptional regulator [Nocardiopsis changdeensis]|uniref:TetR/AcrR family transcriptional regulator n=1 Tax=Nocardiopsis TaxID=2013 RepID=UPI0024085470|nr:MULTISPECIES: helix-turn-helix domain-containing protein [Nocardiopsis]